MNPQVHINYTLIKRKALPQSTLSIGKYRRNDGVRNHHFSPA